MAVFVRCDRRGQFKRCRLVQRFIFHRADAGIAVAVAVQVIALHSAAVTLEAACENTPDGTEVLFAIEGVGEQTAARDDPTAERRIE